MPTELARVRLTFNSFFKHLSASETLRYFTLFDKPISGLHQDSSSTEAFFSVVARIVATLAEQCWGSSEVFLFRSARTFKGFSGQGLQICARSTTPRKSWRTIFSKSVWGGTRGHAMTLTNISSSELL
jgi:hypothetical protein